MKTKTYYAKKKFFSDQWKEEHPDEWREKKRAKRQAKRQRDREKKVWQKAGQNNRHHIVNKCKGGTWEKSNILNWDISKHNAWHFLFKNMSFTEVAELLLRTVQIKDSYN